MLRLLLRSVYGLRVWTCLVPRRVLSHADIEAQAAVPASKLTGSGGVKSSSHSPTLSAQRHRVTEESLPPWRSGWKASTAQLNVFCNMHLHQRLKNAAETVI